MAKDSLPLVSIICIAYNQEPYIADALEGFVKQKTDFAFEVIVADDGSKDSTPEIIEDFQKKYPTIFKPILREKNLGAIPNFLDALRSARGEYIALCEGDDYWTDPRKLQKQVDFMNAHPKCSVSFHRVNVIFQTNEQEDYIFPDVKDPSWYTNTELLKTNFIPTNSVMYRRQNYESLPEDVMPFDWFLHLFHAKFGTVKIIDEVMSVYRKHKGGMWWEYDQDRDIIWREYGLTYANLLMSLEDVYKEDKRALQIIHETLYDFLGKLIEIDDKYGDTLFSQAVVVIGDQWLDFAVDRHRRLIEERNQLQDITQQLLAVGDERQVLRMEVATLQDTLAKIRATKAWRAHAMINKAKRRLIPPGKK